MKLVWLRRDLRVEDNRALNLALASGQPVAAIYVATPKTWQRHGLAPIQADLIFRRLCELRNDLDLLNVPLFYVQVETFTQAAERVADLAQANSVSGVFYNKEYEVDERNRDSYLEQQLSDSDIEVIGVDDKCALRPGSVLNKQGDYFKVFTPFKRAYLTKLYQQPISVLKAKPVDCKAELQSIDGIERFSSACALDYPRVCSGSYSVETNAIIGQLRRFVFERCDQYDQQRDIPSINGTSMLSPYLAIGALSIRQCMARLHDSQTLPLTAGREVWLTELVWRDFYQHLIYFEDKLSKSKSFVEWGDSLTWRDSASAVIAWQTGHTGYPIVDAAMRQLNQTGWMHNRLRMIVASFLVKDLHLDWRVGERYFISHLIDGDYAANNGGWQWCASTGCDGQPYFRIFNPISQGEKFDPQGDFVYQWIPELAKVPRQFIHQPWKWSKAKELSYPSPIVDHKTEREITLSLYKDAKDNVNGT
ncbi:deoxyribodipyrimidine photo-lyase [Vibrio brasiliensis]